MELRLTLIFATGRYHGRDEQGETLEWPPSPLRMFQALVAGSHRGVYGIIHQEARDSALRWLEQLPPPAVVTGQGVETGRALINHVPNNDSLPQHVRASKTMMARAMTGAHALTFLWRFPSDQEALANASVVCAMAPLVMHLGQHQDIVYARGDIATDDGNEEMTASEQITLQPFERIDGQWKAPDAGTLYALQERYRGLLNGASALDYVIPSRALDYQPRDVVKFQAPYALFELWRSDGKRLRQYEARDLRQPSGMVRNALLEWLDANPLFRQYYGEDLTSQLLAGHESHYSNSAFDGAHFAFVPIPSFDKDWQADGQIRRVLVIGYGCETGKARELFADVVNNLNGRPLKDDGKIIGRLLRVVSEKRDAVLRLFIRDEQPCKVWRTVTPIVFTGLTRRSRPPEKLIARALIQAGFIATDIDSVAAFSGPILPKTTRALEYRVNGYLSSTPRYHAEVIFKRPVIGPLVIGRGRYSGFGLMMPYLETPSEQYFEIR
jgi:CRISPR-associated protein Csb2